MFIRTNNYQNLSLYNMPTVPMANYSQQQQYQDINCIIEPTETLGGLYLGNIDAANNWETLRSSNIRAVLTVATDLGVQYPKSVVDFHEVFDVLDAEFQDLSQYFQQTQEFIEEHRKTSSVFVHCYAGISRSATIVLAYLMKTQGMSYVNAYNFVKNRRRQIAPNPGFQNQLRNYDLFLQQQRSYQIDEFSSPVSKSSPKLRESISSPLSPFSPKLRESSIPSPTMNRSRVGSFSPVQTYQNYQNFIPFFPQNQNDSLRKSSSNFYNPGFHHARSVSNVNMSMRNSVYQQPMAYY